LGSNPAPTAPSDSRAIAADITIPVNLSHGDWARSRN
jgi:hypothetical protein